MVMSVRLTITFDKLDVIGNNENLVVIIFLMDEVWIFKKKIIFIV